MSLAEPGWMSCAHTGADLQQQAVHRGQGVRRLRALRNALCGQATQHPLAGGHPGGLHICPPQ
eukprot:scaffold266800_cov21-Prasinocladus_malaysianus.AAC.1